MNKNWKDLALDFILAVVWFSSAYFAVSAFGVARWALYAGLINVILGMLLLLIGTRSESGTWQLYRGIKNDEDRGLNVALLLLAAVPVACIVAGIGWWVLRLIGLLKC